MLAKMIYNRLGGFGDTFHQFFFCNTPHIVRTFYCMNHSLTNTSVCTADTNVLVGSAKTAHYMALKVSQYQKGLII